MTEDIRDFLRPLGLERHCELLEDEAITEVSLLRSMGDEVLRESMQELGMEAADVDVLATALFGGGSDDDDCLVLEENEGGGAAAVAEDADSDDGLALEENLPSHTAAVALEPLPPAAPPGVSDTTKQAAERIKEQGNAALKVGRLTEAVELYGQAIRLDPTNAAYYSNRSSVHATLSDFSSALKDARQCVRLSPDWAKAHTRLGASLSGLRRHNEAHAAYVAAQRCEPTNRQIATLVEAAAEAERDEAEMLTERLDWMQVDKLLMRSQ